MKINSKTGQYSVTDTVTMYALRKIGKNVPFTQCSFFIDEVQSWLKPGSTIHEIVTVEIKLYNGEE